LFLIVVGARVLARIWSYETTSICYKKGFVSKSDWRTVYIHWDDGNEKPLPKSDKGAVILDKIPQDRMVKIGQNVIGYWPGYAHVRYYPGRISGSCDHGKKYFVNFNDTGKRCRAIYEIRTVP
jgi:hypothetical protein